MAKDLEQMSEESIEHWSWIVRAVFQAEHNIVDGWKERLEKAKDTDMADKVADEYVRAIATEILSKSMDFET